MKSHFRLALAWIAITLQPITAMAQSPKPEPVIAECTVAIIHDVQLPSETNGVIFRLRMEDGTSVEDGTLVKKGDLVAQLDDDREQMALKAAQIEEVKAKINYNNDVDIRFARKAADVAKASYDKLVEANEKSRGTVPEVELLRALLDFERSELQIEQSQRDTVILRYDWGARIQEVKAARDSIRRRRIIAPIEGMVVTVFPKLGEWVQAGEPVVRIVSLKELRVDGFVNIRDFAPHQILGRKVTVVVRLTDDEPKKFSGVITFVHPEVQGSGEYRVKAVVQNEKAGDEYLLRPGLNAEMTIHTRGAKNLAKNTR